MYRHAPVLYEIFCDTHRLNESRNVVAVKYRLVKFLTMHVQLQAICHVRECAFCSELVIQ
jgi:hypothetical protein